MGTKGYHHHKPSITFYAVVRQRVEKTVPLSWNKDTEKKEGEDGLFPLILYSGCSSSWDVSLKMKTIRPYPLNCTSYSHCLTDSSQAQQSTPDDCNLSQNPIHQFPPHILSFQYHMNTFTSCHYTTAISLRHYKLKNSVYTIKWSFKRLCKAPWTHLNSDSLYYPSQRQNPLSIPPFIAFLYRVLEVLKVWKSSKVKS